MSSTYGENLKLTIFGQSHGVGIGMVLDGIPAGLPVDEDALHTFLRRRAPGTGSWSTPRKEADRPEILSGVVNGYTCGAPIAALIRNLNTRSGDYTQLQDLPRPGHADLTAQLKYGGFQDAAGGGHFSGRLTAPLCIAGGMCKQWLEKMGVKISAHIRSLASIEDIPFDPICPQMDSVLSPFPVLSQEAGTAMQALICDVKARGDSVGGKIECAITGLPAGLGEPMFGGAENRLAQILFGIPAVKGVEFGDTQSFGSENNDAYTVEDGKVCTLTNHCGGILGGITNAMPLLFTVAVKPTPSIAKTQQTVSLSRMESAELNVPGRHDPCILPRAVPVVEAAAAIAIFDMLLQGGLPNGIK